MQINLFLNNQIILLFVNFFLFAYQKLLFLYKVFLQFNFSLNISNFFKSLTSFILTISFVFYRELIQVKNTSVDLAGHSVDKISDFSQNLKPFFLETKEKTIKFIGASYEFIKKHNLIFAISGGLFIICSALYFIYKKFKIKEKFVNFITSLKTYFNLLIYTIKNFFSSLQIIISKKATQAKNREFNSTLDSDFLKLIVIFFAFYIFVFYFIKFLFNSDFSKIFKFVKPILNLLNYILEPFLFIFRSLIVCIKFLFFCISNLYNFAYSIIVFSLLLSLAIICLSITFAILFAVISSRINSYIEEKEIQKIIKNISEFNSSSETEKTLNLSNKLNLFQGFLSEDSFISIDSIIRKDNDKLIIELDVNDLFKSPEQSIYFNFLDTILAKCIDLIYKTFNLNLKIDNNSIGTWTKWVGNLILNIGLRDNQTDLCKNSQLQQENLKNQEIKFFEKKIKFLKRIYDELSKNDELSKKNIKFEFQTDLNTLSNCNKKFLEEKMDMLKNSNIVIANDQKTNVLLHKEKEEKREEESFDDANDESCDQVISGGNLIIKGTKEVYNEIRTNIYLCLWRVFTGEDYHQSPN